MTTQQFADGNGLVRRYEYDDNWVVAVDLGTLDADTSVDVVGTTAIVVAETGDRVTETEFELPGEDAAVAKNNGVLTITGEQ